jgi:hypothetical protein
MMLFFPAVVVAARAVEAAPASATHELSLQEQNTSRVSTIGTLVRALADASVDRIVIARGEYLIDTQLSIRRNVSVVAVPGTVVLDGQVCGSLLRNLA